LKIPGSGPLMSEAFASVIVESLIPVLLVKPAQLPGATPKLDGAPAPPAPRDRTAPPAPPVGAAVPRAPDEPLAGPPMTPRSPPPGDGASASPVPGDAGTELPGATAATPSTPSTAPCAPTNLVGGTCDPHAATTKAAAIAAESGKRCRGST
jgi:hypothetical protein